jgi:hypothetical protein
VPSDNSSDGDSKQGSGGTIALLVAMGVIVGAVLILFVVVVHKFLLPNVTEMKDDGMTVDIV